MDNYDFADSIIMVIKEESHFFVQNPLNEIKEIYRKRECNLTLPIEER